MPHIETRTVANCNDLTKGARDIAPAKIRWLTSQVVRRSGFILCTAARKEARIGGGRGVKVRFSSSGDVTTHGNSTDPAKVTIEKITREKLPIRPISPSLSVEVLICSGAEYRK